MQEQTLELKETQEIDIQLLQVENKLVSPTSGKDWFDNWYNKLEV